MRHKIFDCAFMVQTRSVLCLQLRPCGISLRHLRLQLYNICNNTSCMKHDEIMNNFDVLKELHKFFSSSICKLKLRSSQQELYQKFKMKIMRILVMSAVTILILANLAILNRII